MDFSDALKSLKTGGRVARHGWNGKGMFVYLVPGGIYSAQTQVAKKEFGSKVPYGAYLALAATDGLVYPWLASQSDVLAEDWSEA